MESNQYETQFSFKRPSFRHENVLPLNNTDKRICIKNMPTFAGKTKENYETYDKEVTHTSLFNVKKTPEESVKVYLRDLS